MARKSRKWTQEHLETEVCCLIPTIEDGKDHVNRVKRREYFRPFAGTILLEHAHEWFDMKGLEQSHMMYAMDCKEGVAEKFPTQYM